jgi:hypothetical protein
MPNLWLPGIIKVREAIRERERYTRNDGAPHFAVEPPLQHPNNDLALFGCLIPMTLDHTPRYRVPVLTVGDGRRQEVWSGDSALSSRRFACARTSPRQQAGSLWLLSTTTSVRRTHFLLPLCRAS